MLNLGNKHSEIIILVYQTVLAIARTIIFEPNAYFTGLFYPNSTYNLTITYTNAYTYTPYMHVIILVRIFQFHVLYNYTACP